MGGQPLFALALVGMPVNQLPLEVIRKILEEANRSAPARASRCRRTHHRFGRARSMALVAIGIVDPRNLKRNAGAKPGDQLVLGKPLGVGIYSAALKKGRSTTRLQRDDRSDDQAQHAGHALGTLDGVHALTDVTGFGLLGHLLEIAKGSKVAARVDWNACRCCPALDSRARESCTGARSQLDGYGSTVTLRHASGEARRRPHRSADQRRAAGRVRPERAKRARDFRRKDSRAAVIGEIVAGAGGRGR
jgi:selenide,water dikinase